MNIIISPKAPTEMKNIFTYATMIQSAIYAAREKHPDAPEMLVSLYDGDPLCTHQYKLIGSVRVDGAMKAVCTKCLSETFILPH